MEAPAMKAPDKLAAVFFDFDSTLSTPTFVPWAQDYAVADRQGLCMRMSNEEITANFGGRDRLERLRAMLQRLQGCGAALFIISFGLAGVIRHHLSVVGLSCFFPVERIFGRESQQLVNVGHSKPELMRRVLGAFGWISSSALFIDDDERHVNLCRKLAVCPCMKVAGRGLSVEEMAAIEAYAAAGASGKPLSSSSLASPPGSPKGDRAARDSLPSGTTAAVDTRKQQVAASSANGVGAVAPAAPAAAAVAPARAAAMRPLDPARPATPGLAPVGGDGAVAGRTGAPAAGVGNARAPEAQASAAAERVGLCAVFDGAVAAGPAALRGLTESMLPLPSSSSGQRKALIVGCSYPSTSPLALKGPLGDAWNMLGLLRHTLQYSESEVRFLVDGSLYFPVPPAKQPSRQAIVDGVRWLVQDARPKDEVLFYFSGRGALRGDVSPAQMDLLTADLDGVSGSALPVVEVLNAFATLPSGCRCTVILDAGFTAGGAPAGTEAKAPWPAELAPRHALSGSGRPADESEGASSLQDAARRIAAMRCELCCILACGGSGQRCAELPLEGEVRGALSWCWCKALLSGRGRYSFDEGCQFGLSPREHHRLLMALLGEVRRKAPWMDQQPLLLLSQTVQEPRGPVTRPLSLALPPGAKKARCRAVLIGVDYVGSHAPLKGCVNDSRHLRCVLTEVMGCSQDEILHLSDSAAALAGKSPTLPTMYNIQAALRWLAESARSGDSIVIAFSGYASQLPRASASNGSGLGDDAQSDPQEAYLVPCDFAADLPTDFELSTAAAAPGISPAQAEGREEYSYRLVPIGDLARLRDRLPAGVTLTIILDCAYCGVPGADLQPEVARSFPRVRRGRVDYSKMRDFVTRPRFLELPPLPARASSFAPAPEEASGACAEWCCCLGACRGFEWAAELPLEGTVQGVFTWALTKALLGGGLLGSLQQLVQATTRNISELKGHFKGVDQAPSLQLSSAATSNVAACAFGLAAPPPATSTNGRRV
eukprot:TRINITY_DN26652_c0_g1_i1.p1 TRINITY_DN26652_c0_g1~~TRINITY_DN26652_c0_g1_i1.p1  ORF type:complete len:998 (+),score=227.25 TRINITY_DN26652_c0_g1_i1:69-3062(+)